MYSRIAATTFSCTFLHAYTRTHSGPILHRLELRFSSICSSSSSVNDTAMQRRRKRERERKSWVKCLCVATTTHENENPSSHDTTCVFIVTDSFSTKAIVVMVYMGRFFLKLGHGRPRMEFKFSFLSCYLSLEIHDEQSMSLPLYL